jgi:hypothetical protein
MLWGSGDTAFGTAGIYCNPSQNVIHAADFAGTSDVRKKENIAVYEPKDIAGEYKTFNFIDDESNQLRVGRIAQELEIKNPEFVRTSNDDEKTKSISYADLHSAEIAFLKAENKKIKASYKKD